MPRAISSLCSKAPRGRPAKTIFFLSVRTRQAASSQFKVTPPPRSCQPNKKCHQTIRRISQNIESERSNKKYNRNKRSSSSNAGGQFETAVIAHLTVEAVQISMDYHPPIHSVAPMRCVVGGRRHLPGLQVKVNMWYSSH